MDNTPDLTVLLERIRSRGDVYSYFFEKLDDPRWLAPLAREGFFKYPIAPEQLENGYVRFPAWPESRALVRLAGSSEDEVVALVLACPDTDNPRVLEDFVDVGLNVSPDRASQLVPRAIEWLTKPYQLLLPLKLGELLQHLARGGELEASLHLAELLLALREDADSSGFGSRAHALFDNWDYKTILETAIPGLVGAAGAPALRVVCDALQFAVRLDGERLGGFPHDASVVWRPSIEDHEQNRDREPKEHLVSAVRDAAGALLDLEISPLTEVVELLSSYGWEIFLRLAMEVARLGVEVDARPAVALMLDRSLFDSVEVSHEYEMLLGAVFAHANPEEQAQLLAWIDDGPSEEPYVARVEAETGSPPTPDELTERGEGWRWPRLGAIPESALPVPWIERQRHLRERFGATSRFPFSIQTHIGSVSPLDRKEAETMSTRQLADYAATIPDDQDRFSSPEEGLASVLKALAKDHPREFSAGLPDFLGQKPLYLRDITGGLREAAASGSAEIAWETILEVAAWILAQPRALEGGSGGSFSDLDPGWEWTIKALTDLVEEGLRHLSIDESLRERLWAILIQLAQEPDEASNSGMDDATESLNRTASQAMHAVVLYANWLFEAQRGMYDPPIRSFETNSPEVLAALNGHLDGSLPSSPAVRAVYGMRMSLLAKLDPSWLESNVDQIFSRDDRGRLDRLGEAAWASYLRYGGRYLDVMRMLGSQYVRAVGRLEVSTQNPTDPELDLAEHIMVMYWHGILGEEPVDASLLQGFYARASTVTRTRALEFIGHSLREAREDVDALVLRRLQRLWDSRVAHVRVNPRAGTDELKAFGWWISSDLFDPAGSVSRLLEVLQLAGEVDPDHLAVAALVSMDAQYLEQALTCLLLIIQADTNGWGVYGWKEDAVALIQAGLAADDASRRVALDAANVLVARGFTELRPLVRSAE